MALVETPMEPSHLQRNRDEFAIIQKIAGENFRLKGLCVAYAVMHRCPGDRFPVVPHG